MHSELPDGALALQSSSDIAQMRRIVTTEDDSSILSQIEAAFQIIPDAAGIIHGKRRIKRGCRGRRTSLFSSQKSGGGFLLESGPELAHALCLESDPNVLSFRTQAIRIPLPNQGQVYPDFLVRRQTHIEVHEVKASFQSLGATQTQRYREVARVLARVGVIFKIIEGDKLPIGSEFDEMCYRYSRASAVRLAEDTVARALQLLVARSPISLADAYVALADSRLPTNCADYLIFHGRSDIFSGMTLMGGAK